jgi:YggT family protein
MGYLITFVDLLFRALIILVFAHVILSYFLAPYHPLRVGIARMIEPLLAPIRRVIPSTGMIDFSPMVLLILLYVLEGIIRSLLRSI